LRRISSGVETAIARPLVSLLHHRSMPIPDVEMMQIFAQRALSGTAADFPTFSCPAPLTVLT
jgi:hypothetical protein